MPDVQIYDRFIALYRGLDRAYGKYILDENLIVTDGEKAKGRGITVSEDLLADQYTEHLDGENMLGVVPIQDGNLCSFAAIDIDDYNLDIAAVLKHIADMKLPLVATRSKSGGLHLWMFFVDPIPARAVIGKMEEIADSLGFPGVEIFPKQHQIGPDDVGNWINLPWFDHEKTVRYGWTDDFEEQRELASWVEYAESRKITLKELNRINVRETNHGGERPFADGPPCLQTLAERGIGEGMRNNVMFSVGVYAHTKFDENVDQISFMHDANRDYFDPRMDDRELETIRHAVDQGEYRYPCNQAPIKDVCNRQTCLRRKYGVRLNGETFSFSTLWQFVPVTMENVELPDEGHWRLQINHNDDQHMLDLSTDELLVFRSLRKKAINRRISLPQIDNNEWNDLIEQKIQACEVVHVPEALSSVGVVRHYISQFLSMHAVGTESKMEVMHGKAWHEEIEDVYWFRSEYFLAYLKSQRYADYTGTKLYNILKERFGFDMTRRRIGDDNVRIWMCPAKLRIHKDTDVAPPGFKEVF